MLVLFDTPAGYTLFQQESGSPSLVAFDRFDTAGDAVAAATALGERTVDKQLKSFLKSSIVKNKEFKGMELGVIDPKLGKLGVFGCVWWC